METVFIDENIPYLEEIISQKYRVIKFKGRELNNDMLKSENCFALFVRSTTIVNEDLLQNTSVKFVATGTSGIDHVDLDYLKNNNIKFSYALGANANSVAEYVMFSILFDVFSRRKNIHNLTIGIIGYGNIGKKLARYCNRAQMNILINDPPLKEQGFSFPEQYQYSELDKLLLTADIITNHVPLKKNGEFPTLNLLNCENFQDIKENALFIHTSRGGVVCEKDLVKLLKTREDVELVIDVYENEPEINEYLVQRAIIATPHIAGYSRNGKINGISMILKDFEEFIHADFDKNLLNYEFTHQSTNCLICDCVEMYEKISQSRKILDDSLKFNDILNYSGFERRDEFDRQRREYPVRYEYMQMEDGELKQK